MKSLSKYLSILLCMFVACGIASCGNDEPDPVESDIIYLPTNSGTKVTIRYDESETPNAIKFNATGDWTAEIYPANSHFEIIDTKSFSKVDWLEVSPFAGSAGSWSLTAYTAPNHTTESRYAVVVLNSLKSTVKIQVIQDGMAGGGDSSVIPNPEN